MTYGSREWWENAISRNRAALLRVVTVLWFRAGLDEGGAESLPHASWRAILALLRPAESAVRRLVFIAARDIAVTLRRRAARKAVKWRAIAGPAGLPLAGEPAGQPSALAGDPAGSEAQLAAGARTATAW
ncbi:MAG: hypothetical protein WAU86_09775, partial [Oricola sp.]